MKMSSTNEYKVDPVGKIVVDIGAHIGGFVTYVVQRRAERVYGFESNPETYDLLVKNCGHYPNVELFNSAVWWNTTDKLGVYTLHNCVDANTGAKGVRELEEGDTPAFAPILFEDFVKEKGLEKIDILKLDCEAAEYPILYTMPLDILQRIDYITAEVHPQEYYEIPMNYEFGEYGFSVEELVRYLRDNGFEVNYNSVVREGTVRRSFMQAKRK
jgi:FkbM family methyltransferase